MRPYRVIFFCIGLFCLSFRSSADDIELRGQIVDPEGEGVAMAAVALRPWTSPFEEEVRRLKDEDASPAEIVRSDRQGRFVLTAPPGSYRLLVKAKGYLPMEMTLTHRWNDTELRTLHLVPKSDLTVRVVGTDGKPIADAWVRLKTYYGSYDQWRPRTRHVRTGPDGQVRLSRVAPEHPSAKIWRGQVTADAPRLVPPDAQDLDSNALTFELAAGKPRVIEVRDARGRPVAGALIRIGKRAQPVGVSADDGRWTTFPPPTGDLKVTAETADGAWGSRRVSAPGVGEKAPVIIELEPPATLSGQVIDVRTERSVAGARVWLDRNPGYFADSGRDGSYTLSIPASRRGGAQLQAVAEGYLRKTSNHAYGPSDASRSLKLQPIAPLDGRAVDASGSPIEGAEITAIARQDSREWLHFARSQNDGSFRLAAVLNMHYRVEVSKLGYVSTSAEAAARTSSEGLEIVLQPGLSGSGRVVDQDDQPISGAKVILASLGPSSRRFRWQPDFTGHRTSTDAEGGFEFRHLEPETVHLEVTASGYARTQARSLQIVQDDDGQFDFGTLVLEPGVHIEGRVVDSDDRPLAGVIVQWTAFDSGAIRDHARQFGPKATSDEDGRFRVPDLARGEKLSLEARLDGYSSAQAVGVEAPNDEPVILVLSPQATLRGIVVDNFGEPAAEATVTVQDKSTEGSSGGNRQPCKADGTFELHIDASERLQLRAASKELRSQATWLEVAPGQIIDNLRLVLEPGAAVEGKVLGPEGEPVPDARVVGFGEALLSNTAQDMTDEAGHFRLAGLEHGALSLQVNAEGFPRAHRNLEVGPDTPAIEIRLRSSHEVSGRVVDDSLRPIGGAWVQLSGKDGSGDTVTDAEGAFHMTVPDGSYRLSAGKRNAFARNELEERIEVSGASVTGLEIQLNRGGAIVGRILGLDPERLSEVYVTARRGGSTQEVDREGNYRIEHLRPQEWTVVATLRGNGRNARGRVVLDPGAQEAILDLEFTSGLTLIGRVLIDDRPSPGAMVLIFDLDRPSTSSRFGAQYATTDYRGGFRFVDLDPGHYRLEVRQDSMVRHREIEMVVDREIEIELRSHELSGRVVDTDTGDPLERAQVALEPIGKETAMGWPSSETDSSGRFHFARIAEGDYHLRVSLADYAPLTLPLEVAEGANLQDLELSLERTDGLKLNVQLATGERPGQVWVAALGGAGEVLFNLRLQPNENDQVNLSSLPAGRWRLLVGAIGAGTIPLTVDAPGEPVPVLLHPDTTLDVRIPDLENGTESATLNVVGTDGQAFLELSAQRHLPIHQWTVEAGRATVTGLPPGQWTVHVTAAGGRTWSIPVSAPPQGGRQQLQIE